MRPAPIRAGRVTPLAQTMTRAVMKAVTQGNAQAPIRVSCVMLIAEMTTWGAMTAATTASRALSQIPRKPAADAATGGPTVWPCSACMAIRGHPHAKRVTLLVGMTMM